MHDIEPYHHWLDRYDASEDENSPFYGRTYNEFAFENKIYNYFIHPQWDHFGSSTLYIKQLYTDYIEGFVIFELIGEWNDTLHNDIMLLKRYILEPLMKQGISKFILIAENVLNFHGSDDCYYQEWQEEVYEMEGWITFINLQPHVQNEMSREGLHRYISLDKDLNWRKYKPQQLFQLMENQR